jgi:hypothetical protein
MVITTLIRKQNSSYINTCKLHLHVLDINKANLIKHQSGRVNIYRTTWDHLKTSNKYIQAVAKERLHLSYF